MLEDARYLGKFCMNLRKCISIFVIKDSSNQSFEKGLQSVSSSSKYSQEVNVTVEETVRNYRFCKKDGKQSQYLVKNKDLT